MKTVSRILSERLLTVTALACAAFLLATVVPAQKRNAGLNKRLRDRVDETARFLQRGENVPTAEWVSAAKSAQARQTEMERRLAAYFRERCKPTPDRSVLAGELWAALRTAGVGASPNIVFRDSPPLPNGIELAAALEFSCRFDRLPGVLAQIANAPRAYRVHRIVVERAVDQDGESVAPAPPPVRATIGLQALSVPQSETAFNHGSP